MRRALFTVSALSLTLAVLTGCGSSAKKLCKKTADCDPSYDVDQCMDDYEQLEEMAEELDCTDALDDFVKCAGKEGECVDGYVEAAGCTGETLAYFECFFGDTSLSFTFGDTGY